MKLEDRIPIYRPEDPMDRLRFNAQLRKLGLPEPKTRSEITRKEADQYVKGGFHVLSDAARTSGRRDAVDEQDLNNVQAKGGHAKSALVFLGLVKDPREVADEKVKNAIKAADAAASMMREAKPGSFDMFNFMTATSVAGVQIQEALGDETLGAASQECVNQLRDTIAALHNSFSRMKAIDYPPGGEFGGWTAFLVENFRQNMNYLCKELPQQLEMPTINVGGNWNEGKFSVWGVPLG
jgi:hypothetical protein